MWWPKVVGVVAAAIVGIGVLEASEGKWVLATDVQKYYRCLPYEWYLVTNIDGVFDAKRGELVQFRAPAEVERITQAYSVIKIVAGVPGDRWAIRNDELYINGEPWGSLHLLQSIGKARGSLDGSGVIPEGHVYVLGTNPSSYDSRYWGPLPNRYIEGKAHVIY